MAGTVAQRPSHFCSLLAIIAATLLSGCGGTSLETAPDSPAQNTAGTVSPVEDPPGLTAYGEVTSSTPATTPPPGPQIGEFVQPEDVIVMVDRDETTPSGKAVGKWASKVADTISDDANTGVFTRYGPTNCGTVGTCWKEASIGYNSHMWWTWNNTVTESNYGIWKPYLQCAGTYTVSAYIPSNNATTTQARYKISHINGTTQQNINQNNYYSVWVPLGANYSFNSGSGGTVKLADATGETTATKRIGFDAMKWSYVSPTPSMWLTVSSPNGGETWYKSNASGTCVPVTWNSSGISDNVRIHLYRYGSISKGLNNSVSNTGSYCVPKSAFSDQTPGGGYTIGMSNVNTYCDGVVSDFSNSTFTIANSTISVSSPSTGTYTSGNTVNVNWSSAGVSGNVKIDLYAGGSFYTTIINSTGNSGSYSWSIPSNYNGSGYTIRVSSVNDTTVYGTSSGTFGFSNLGGISGTVTNTSGSSLSGVTIQIDGSSITSTGGSGQYSVGGVSPGDHTVGASLNGYYSSSKSVTVYTGSTSTANFTLTKIPTASLYYSPNNIGVTMNSGSLNGTQSFVIKNNGDGTLVYTLSPNVSWASIQRNGATVSGVQQSLAPGIQAAFTVVFNSNGITTSQSGSIAISSNDSTQSAAAISLGMGINAPPPQPPPPAEQPPPSKPAFQPADYGQCQVETNRCYADPVNTAIGNYIYEHTDLAIAARGPDLVFSRHYNSLDTTIGPLGQGWTHSLNIYLVIAGNGDVYVRWGTGQTDWYTYNSSTGGFTPPAGTFDELTKNSQYILTDNGQNVWIFSAAGQLQSITDLHNNKLTLAYDTQGRLTTATNSVGDTFTYAYIGATDSLLASVTDTASRKIQFAYNGTLLTQVTDAKGKSSTYGYDSGSRLNKITERDGKVLVNNTYDSSNRVTSQTDALGNVTQFAYNTPGAGQTSITDPSGKTHTYSYDSLYRLISQAGPTGDQVSFLYNTANRPTQVIDANGKITKSTYDTRGNVLSVTDATGATSLWSYDVLDRITSATNPLGQTTSYSYDTNGNLSQISSTLVGIAHTTTLTYLSTGELASTIDPMGATTTYTYSSKGELTSIKNANNETVQFGYDTLHRRISVTDPIGNSRSTTYDANDNATSETNALNQTLTITYDARDQRSTVNSPEGTASFTYDNGGRLTQAATPTGSTSYTYNTINQQTSVTDPAGNKTTFTYNTLGYMTGITDSTNKSVTFSYDPMGHLLSSTDTAGITTSFTLDAIGRPTKVTDPLGNAVSASYNNLGRATQTVDPAGNTFKTTYDSFGRPIQSTNSLLGVTSQTYDKNSRLTKVTTPNGAAHSWTYDAVGRITLVTSPSGKKKSFAYDAAGRLASFTNANNQATTFTYDAGDRVTQTSFSDGVVRSITYDAANRPTQITQAGKARAYSYDTAGRISSSTDVWGKTVGYTYNTAGRLSTLTYPGNKAVAYGYDSTGRLTSVTDWNGGVTAYSYDSAGRLIQTSLPNGVKTTRSYDSNSRVTSIQHKKNDGTLLYGQTVTYDSRGNVTSSEVTPEPTGWITVDSVDYTPNIEDQYTNVGSDILGYDPVGQLLSHTSGSSYAFDASERMTAALTPAVSASFAYGPDGERIEKVVEGTATRYVVDTNRPLPAVIAELNASNLPTTYYIYGIGLLAQVPATGTAAHYYHTDNQSNIVALTDAAGDVTDTYFYHPFGKVLAKTGTTPNPFQFVGALGVEQDETGLHYMRARYYDPVIGRFITKDPLGLAAGNNQYAYGINNPMSFSDPSGLCIWDLCLGEAYIAATIYITALVSSPDLQTDINFIAYDVTEFSNDPSFINGFALTMDSVAALIPGVTGAGTATRTVGKSVDQVVNNMIDGGMKMSGVYGNAETRLLNAKVATELEQKGYEIVNIGSKELGMKEKYLPGVGGGTKGSAKVDVTAVGNGKTINVNTIDTYANGLATSREALNAERIAKLDPNSELYLVAKSALNQAGPYLPQIQSITKTLLPHFGGVGAATASVINYFTENVQSMSGGSGK